MNFAFIDYLDSEVNKLATIVGKPDDQIRLMLCMYMGYPLGYILRYIVKGRVSRHIFSTITGLLLQIFMFRDKIVHTFIMTIITYLMMILLPRNFQHKAVFAFVMLYLSCSHIYRMITNFGGWEMDITTYTMILTAKLSALAYCYKDGSMKDSDLLPEQIERKVTKLPSVLELLSYVFFCCACISGPFFEYSDYIQYIESKGRYAHTPNTIIPSMKKFIIGQLCLGFHMWVGGHYYALFCGTHEFTLMSWGAKVVYYYIAMTSQRFLYYTGWSITDGAVIASGLGYSGKDKKTGEDTFTQIISINIFDVELSLSPQIMMQHWNHQIHIWLKHYIYNRTLVPGKRPGLYNNMATFITSAFWHGFYPFYYVMFFFCALLGELSKDVYRSRIFFRWIPSPLNSILANFVSMLTMNYLGISFMLLTFENAGSFSKTLYHFVYIYIVLLFVIFRFGGIPKMAAKLEEKIKAKTQGATTVKQDELKKNE